MKDMRRYARRKVSEDNFRPSDLEIYEQDPPQSIWTYLKVLIVVWAAFAAVLVPYYFLDELPKPIYMEVE